MKKTLLVTGLLTCLILGGLITVQAKDESAPQIGYVDMQKLFKNHPRKQDSEDKLRGEAKQLQEKLESEAEDLNKEERQKLLQKYQQELDKLEKQLIQGVMEDINQKIQQVAEEKGVNVVLDQSAVLSGGYNLTEEVLTAIREDSSQDKAEEENLSQDK